MEKNSMVRIKSSLRFWLPLFFLLLPISAIAGPTVLFDQGHGQQFLSSKNGPLDLSGLAALFTDQGATLRTSEGPLTTEALSGVDILIISGPFFPITEPEINAIIQFIDHGGRLAVMAHTASPLTPLLHRLKISISSAAIYEQLNVLGSNGRDFMVNHLKDHPLTRKMDGFMVYGGWALMGRGKDMQEIANTSQNAWIDLNGNGILNEKDAKQAFSLIIVGQSGQGSYAVFGDDAIFQNQFLKGGNLLLGGNMARWFCSSRPAPKLF
jgi:hypothetical protein